MNARLQAAQPVKVIVVPRNGPIPARVRAEAEAAAKPPDEVGEAAARLVPRDYSPGAFGWSVPITIEEERNAQGQLTGRAAVIAEELFARGRPDFAGADDKLPGDWVRPAQAAPTAPQGGGRT